MNRVLVIDQDRATREALGLACLGRNVAVAFAENVCEGVRTLLTLPVSLIVVDAAALRMTIREHVVLFDRVAPGIPVVVSVAAETPLDSWEDTARAYWQVCERVLARTSEPAAV